MVGRSVSQEPTMADAVSYIESVKEEFHDEPAKFDEFRMRLNEVRDDRVEKDRITARINELISGNPKLHLGSKVFFPEAEITIPPKVEQRHESVDAKKKRANRENHRKKKLKCLDSLVFPPMTKKIDEGKKSVKKVHKKFLVLSKVDRTIPPDANKELRKSRTMFGKSVPLEKTLDDARSYIDSVKEAFHDEPAKYAEFLKLLNDYKARRLDADSVIARVDELTKDHRNLLLGLRAILLPAAKSTIPHKAKGKRTARPEASRTIPVKLKITIIPPKARRTIPSEADKPTHTDELNFMNKLPPKRRRTIPSEAEKPTHTDELNFMNKLPTKRRRTIPSEAEKPTHTDELNFMNKLPTKARRTIPSEAEKPTHTDELNFMNKLKTRFQRIDTHVVGSFHSIMTMYKEGKKSRKEVHEEVCDLLYYHEDLRADFTRIFPKLGSFRINISTISVHLFLEIFEVVYTVKRKLLARSVTTRPYSSSFTVSLKLTMDDDYRLEIASTIRETVTYIADVKEAFLDEPAKFHEFLRLMNDVCDHKIEEANGSARMAEIIKGHPRLLLVLSVFFPKSKQYEEAARSISSEASRTIPPKATIPPKSSRTISPKANRTIPPKSKKTFPREAKRTIPREANRNRIMPSEAKKTIHPEDKRTTRPVDHLAFFIPKAKRTIPPAESNKNKKNARFQGYGSHVVNSVLQILKMYSEGNKSKDEAYQEVVSLLQNHVDLVMEFGDYFSGISAYNRFLRDGKE
ncbi:Hypothetical protein [Arabidopsis thaliana]|uniref:F3I6.15 protein n=1 Tax=Arabidopsis thaliana TaxID=3702 RepID=O48689_ARATH|nr:paired amphipathic helix repeat-containing protein [Arabidopsis thaliana]NP_173832.1 paired amphipathic helix repeat-containing protein [Arabidopsis thaliana]AAC00582.1 Hypothetical protein [Arabidopsis thaliana]AEE30497.1 paired amphipathic helix repeat-containing protein [Arabidopsis thaliana]ANM59952.1 paired amphipathic helix repeat-containing protein [Arabidopsis thaliana]|eukprot:NP_001319074.1 paired amphipathic helix repeat-containing protein [Arabidopsis thaliana]